MCCRSCWQGEACRESARASALISSKEGADQHRLGSGLAAQLGEHRICTAVVSEQAPTIEQEAASSPPPLLSDSLLRLLHFTACDTTSTSAF